MILLVSGLVVMVLAGVAALGCRRIPRLAGTIAVSGVLSGSALALMGAFGALTGRAPARFTLSTAIASANALANDSGALAIDALGAFFLLVVLVVSSLAAIYGLGYLERNTRTGASWFFFNVLVASMAFVVVADDGFLFLIAWELAALSSYFLVVQHDERAEVRRAGWVYLVAAHVGAAFLVVFFVLLGQHAGSLRLVSLAGPLSNAAPLHVMFVCALIGFGTKAGLVPLHPWLVEAYPVAPSHVSAVLSGAMSKLGIYGLARVLTLLDPQEPWGWTLIFVGSSSTVLAILLALPQRDLKRSIAYSSAENLGIVAMAMGLGVFALTRGNQGLAVVALAGGLLHVANHAVFKTLLFLAAGALQKATGTLDIERLGGLLRRMPITGAVFLVGALAICALPPFNGFASEFILLVTAFDTAISIPFPVDLSGLIVVLALGLASGLALACFARLVGIVWLGEPRSDSASAACEVGFLMQAPMIVLAIACLAIGLGVPWMLSGLERPIAVLMNTSSDMVGGVLKRFSAASLRTVVSVGAVLFGTIVALAVVRKLMLRDREVSQHVTWGCGYTATSSRIQYTGSSFAEPITELFAPLIPHESRIRLPTGTLPEAAELEKHTLDPCEHWLYAPAFRTIRSGLGSLRWIQHGRIRLYVLYIIVTLLVLLAWNVG